jgi:hypothetical protein
VKTDPEVLRFVRHARVTSASHAKRTQCTYTKREKNERECTITSRWCKIRMIILEGACIACSVFFLFCTSWALDKTEEVVCITSTQAACNRSTYLYHSNSPGSRRLMMRVMPCHKEFSCTSHKNIRPRPRKKNLSCTVTQTTRYGKNAPMDSYLFAHGGTPFCHERVIHLARLLIHSTVEKSRPL